MARLLCCSFAAFLSGVLLLSASAFAGEPVSPPDTAANPVAPIDDLSVYQGEYAYRDGLTLFMVADGGRLIALINEGKYPLTKTGVDTFANGSGDALPFHRDDSGQVIAFFEKGDRFLRRTAAVPAALRALLAPRAAGADGKVAVYRYVPPPALEDGIATARAGADSLPLAVAEQLVNSVIDGRAPEVRSLLVYHKGALRLEEYFYGFDRARPHPMRSLTKSVIALAAGAAVDRKLLTVDAPVLPLLGFSNLANPDPRKETISLRDLLSNQSGLACDDRDGQSPGNEVKIYEQADWVKAVFDLPVLAEPGTVGRYCSGGIIAAGRVIERASKRGLPAFAQDSLLAPLGIKTSDWQWTFKLDPSQRNEFGQIYLRPRDMLKLGILILQRGLWQGKRVLSSEWVEAVTAQQSKVDGSDYGLGIWHRWFRVKGAPAERIDTLMLSGNGGQKVFLVPALELVVVFTGGAFNVNSPVNSMMANVLLPALLPSANP